MQRLLIVNPFASGVDEHRLAAVTAALPEGTEVRITHAGGEATSIASALTPDTEVVYVFGGDGTYNEVLNGAPAHVTLGFLPGGGTSVLPRALGLPRNPVDAALRLAQGETRVIGVGRVNGRRFGFSAGIGFDAELVREVDRLGRSPDGRRPGDRAFAGLMARTLTRRRGRFDPVLEIEGLGRAAFCLVGNCSPYTYAGAIGLDLVPGASFDEGLALFAPTRVRGWELPRLAAGAVGVGRPERSSTALHATDLDAIVVRCDEPLPLQVDGEDVGDVTEAVYVAERDAVTVLV